MPVSEYSKDADRTTDVQTHDETPFSAFAGDHPKLLKGLTDCGYVTASPIQVAALPVVIAGNGEICARVFTTTSSRRFNVRRYDRRGEKRDRKDAYVCCADSDEVECGTESFAECCFGADARNSRANTTVFQKSRPTLAE